MLSESYLLITPDSVVSARMGRCKHGHVPDEVRMNIHHASNLASIRLILLLILSSPVLCVDMRLQNPTDI